MGTNPAPPLANNFMAKVDNKIWVIAKKLNENENIDMKSLNIFLDGLFSICLGSTKMLHKLWEENNKMHPSVKFTMQHTTPDHEKPEYRCECEPLKLVPYLDTSCSINNGQTITDLYRKPKHRNR